MANSAIETGWRQPRFAPSLAEVYRTVPVQRGAWWKKALAFAGPGYLVAVGYMDPGNWATDLAGGARFGYTLLSVILLSNLMAILLQGLAAKLGIVSGRDLAQACRDHYSRPVSFFLWVICEIAIAACDLAEVIGSAIALNLLFGIPLPWGIAITSLDVLIVLYMQQKGFRLLEALVVVLIATIAGCFLFEILIAKPEAGAMFSGFLPSASILKDPDKLYIAIGILGATVMPHNLYLHSSVVQTRSYEETAEGKREAVKFAFIDSTVALSFALFINAAILVVAAATFHRVGETGVAEIQDAYRLLTPLLGVTGHGHVYPDVALLDLHRKATHIVSPEVERAATRQVKAGVMPVAGQDAIVDRAFVQPFQRCRKQQQMVLLPHGIVGGTSQVDKDFLRAADIGIEIAHPFRIDLFVVDASDQPMPGQAGVHESGCDSRQGVERFGFGVMAESELSH